MSTPHQTLGTAMEETFGKTLVRNIGRCFELMEIAEEEIAKAPSSTPFLALQPPEQLAGKDDRVYRMHVRELLQRQGVALAIPTHAEMCCGYQQLSLLAPLNHAAAWLYWGHFDAIFPEKMEEPYADDWDRGEGGEDIERSVLRQVIDESRNQHNI